MKAYLCRQSCRLVHAAAFFLKCCFIYYTLATTPAADIAEALALCSTSRQRHSSRCAPRMAAMDHKEDGNSSDDGADFLRQAAGLTCCWKIRWTI